jgi:hypothetical protein
MALFTKSGIAVLRMISLERGGVGEFDPITS